MACFEPGDEVTTEIPNLLISGSGKKKPPGDVAKRPAGLVKRPAAAIDPAVRCHLEFYKRSNTFCIRQSESPRRNILAVKNATWSKERLQKVAKEAQQKISDGMAEDEVRSWVEWTVG